MESLKDKIEKYVTNSLCRYKPSVIEAPKVIHEAITGSNLFQPHEIALLDLPIVQRLRSINQVGLANLVFPSSNHCRFDHTVGVAVLVEKYDSVIAKFNDGTMYCCSTEEIVPQRFNLCAKCKKKIADYINKRKGELYESCK